MTYLIELRCGMVGQVSPKNHVQILPWEVINFWKNTQNRVVQCSIQGECGMAVQKQLNQSSSWPKDSCIRLVYILAHLANTIERLCMVAMSTSTTRVANMASSQINLDSLAIIAYYCNVVLLLIVDR